MIESLTMPRTLNHSAPLEAQNDPQYASGVVVIPWQETPEHREATHGGIGRVQIRDGRKGYSQ